MNPLSIFSIDFWSKPIGHSSGYTRPQIKPKSFETHFRPYQAGKGQDIRNELYWTIPFKQQKMLYLRNSWVKKCIDHVCLEMARLDWMIVPKQEYIGQLKYDERLNWAVELSTAVFNRKNTDKDTFRNILQKIVRDLKIMDGGVIEKVRDDQGMIVALKAIDAADIRIDIDIYGQVQRYIQDLQGSNLYGKYHAQNMLYADENQKGNLRLREYDPNDIVYMKLVDRTESPYGSSPIASLVEAIYADLSTDINLFHFLNTGGTNRGYLSVGEHLNLDDVEKIRDAFRRYQQPGRIYDLPIFSTTEEVKYQPISVTNNEAQMHELQVELRNKILAVLSVPSNELGLSTGNRGQVYSQQDVFWAGVIQIADKIAQYITDEILYEFDPRLEFVFAAPEEHQFESKLSRVITMEEQGYIEEDIIPLYLNIPAPKIKPYIKRKKELELRSLELQVENLEMETLVAKQRLQYQVRQPELEHAQITAQTKMMVDQSQSTDEQTKLQLRQLELEEKRLELEELNLNFEAGTSKDEMELRKTELMLQKLTLQQQMAALTGQQPTQGISNQDLVQAVQAGQINTAQLAEMVQEGQVDPEQMKEISSSQKLVSSLGQVQASPNLAKAVQTIKPLEPFKGTNNSGLITDVAGGTSDIYKNRNDKLNKPFSLEERIGSFDKIGKIADNLSQPLKGKASGGRNYVKKELRPWSMQNNSVFPSKSQDKQQSLEINQGDKPTDAEQ